MGSITGEPYGEVRGGGGVSVLYPLRLSPRASSAKYEHSYRTSVLYDAGNVFSGRAGEGFFVPEIFPRFAGVSGPQTQCLSRDKH